MGYHYNLAQLISLQVIDSDSVLFASGSPTIIMPLNSYLEFWENWPITQ